MSVKSIIRRHTEAEKCHNEMNELFRPDQISFCSDDIYLVWTILTRQYVHDWRHNQPLNSQEYTFAVLLEI